MLAKDGDGAGKKSAPVSDDGQCKGDANECEADAKDAPAYCDRDNVSIAWREKSLKVKM